jgi:hypothetical protein
VRHGVFNLDAQNRPSQMFSSSDKTTLTPRDRADLSALADGTIDPARRAAVEARIAQSPQLTAVYERERQFVEMVHRANEQTRAPLGLRQRIEAQRPSARARARRRFGYGGGLAGALAAVVLALILLLPGASPGAPSVSQAAELATLGPAQSAPAPDPTAPAVKLLSNVEDVYFPNWSRRFDAQAVGQRRDRFHGRLATTVYYRWQGRIVAYTIVGLPALSQPSAKLSWRNGTELRTFEHNGRHVVSWRRDGRTCILSSAAVAPARLQKLAAWTAPAIK